MKRIVNLLRKYEHILSYLFFGAMTTLVNFLVYFPMFNWLHLPAVVCNIVAWAVAVCFAYFTNKPFVFKSYDWSLKTIIDEGVKFVGCRVGSGAFETVVVWLLVDVCSCNGNWTKIIVSVVVVILNYVSSKWFVFK